MATSVKTQKFFEFNLHKHVGRHLKDHFIPHERNAHRPHVLAHRTLLLYSVFLLLLKVALISAPILLPYSLAISSAVTPENIISLTNQSRVERNLPPLVESAKLAAAADSKARDMMKKAYFAHFSPDGISPWFWMAKAGYNYQYAGENLAIRFETAEGVNDAWLSSPAHRANILADQFTEIGVAVASGEFGDEGQVTLVVQMFGDPASAGAEVVVPTPAANSDAKVGQKILPPTGNEIPNNPVILFPLSDSLVNFSRFSVIGQNPEEGSVAIFLDGVEAGFATALKDLSFEFLVPDKFAFTDGLHNVYASYKFGESYLESDRVNFVVDTSAPEVFADTFDMRPLAGKMGYKVSVKVSEDSIRTIVTI
ncbi:MAG: CAP domain-containing protein, partial [Patescibacteria group bacterium]